VNGLVAFARDQLGLTFYPGQAEVLDAWGASGKRKALFLLGRRSGKGLMAAVAAIFNAVSMDADYQPFLRWGERRHILFCGNRIEQAAEGLRPVRELVAAAPDKDVRGLIDERACTATEVVFKNGVIVRALPCSSRSSRGLGASMLVFDEAGSYFDETSGYAAGRMIWRALLPSTAQFGSLGQVVVTSTPGWNTGLLHDLWKAHELGSDPDLFAIRRPTWECNPRITRESLQSEFDADPEGAQVEYGAQFATGGGALLDPDSVAAAVVQGRTSLPYMVGARYCAVADPGFAAGGSEFALAIGHPEFQIEDDNSESTVVILDRLLGWRGSAGPLNSDVTLDEVATALKEFHVHEVISDQYSVVPISDGLRRRGIDLIAQPLTSELKSDIYASLKRSLNLGRVELLDDRTLTSQLVNLTIRPTPSGKPKIAAGSGRDDRAMVVATLVHSLTTATELVSDNYPVVASVGTRLQNFE
jgi:hypothetical protein